MKHSWRSSSTVRDQPEALSWLQRFLCRFAGLDYPRQAARQLQRRADLRRLDAEKLAALATSHGGLVETIGSVRVIRPDPAKREAKANVDVERPDDDGHVTVRRRHAGSGPMVAFLEPGLIAFGEENTVRAAIEHGGNGRSIRDNQEMVNLIGDLEGSSNAWAVGANRNRFNTNGSATF